MVETESAIDLHANKAADSFVRSLESGGLDHQIQGLNVGLGANDIAFMLRDDTDQDVQLFARLSEQVQSVRWDAPRFDWPIGFEGYELLEPVSAEHLLRLCESVRMWLYDSISKYLNEKAPGEELVALMMELWTTHYDKFDEDDRYSNADVIPCNGETPRDLLTMLIGDAITARCMKTRGKEICRAWTKRSLAIGENGRPTLRSV